MVAFAPVIWYVADEGDPLTASTAVGAHRIYIFTGGKIVVSRTLIEPKNPSQL